MTHINHMKQWLSAALGTMGGLAAQALGGWDSGAAALVTVMALDYLSGLIAAGVFHASPKSASGALESKAGWKGLCRKGMTLAMVLIACQLDSVLGTTFVRDSVVTGFIVNELISLLENAALMGVSYPKALTNALDILKGRDNSTDDKNE